MNIIEHRVVDGILNSNKTFIIMPILIAMCLISSCGYHFTGSGINRLTPGQSIWVSFFSMEINSPSIQNVLRRAILEEGHAMRGLYLSGNATTADFRVNGKLRAYNLRPMSYNTLDQVSEYRLTVEVDLELFQKGEPAPIWKGTVQSYQDYPANMDLSLQRSAEEAALAAASRTLAQKFLIAVEQAY